MNVKRFVWGMRRIVLVAPAVAVLSILVAGASTASAEALSPWWGLYSSQRPTNLHAGAATSEEQEITASPGKDAVGEKGVAFELKVGGNFVGIFATEEYATVDHLPEPTPENIEKALEGEEFYGKGNVTVRGEPPVVGSPLGSIRLIIKSVNRGSVAPLEVISLSGVPGEANTKIVAPGRPDGEIVVTAQNLGDGPAEGSVVPIRLADLVPAGLKVVAVEEVVGKSAAVCSPHPEGESPVVCTFGESLEPYGVIEMRISVIVENEAELVGALNRMSVSGGGAVAEKSIVRPLSVGGLPSFGVDENTFAPEEAGGGFDSQAGSHPFQVTSVQTFNQLASTGHGAGGNYDVFPVALPKDQKVLTPPGLVGNPTPFVRCTDQQFLVNPGGVPDCPAASVVGMAVITLDEPALYGVTTVSSPIFNLVPNEGEPARFGFYVEVVPVFLNASVRTGSDYGVTIGAHNISEIQGLLSTSITFWGVPGNPAHNGDRGYPCISHESSCVASEEAVPPPFVTMPTSCTGPLQASAQVDSWANPGEVLSDGLSEPLLGLDGCDHPPFDPQVGVAPDGSSASTPSGLTVGIHVPQTAELNPSGIAESTLRDTTVTLPAGVALNPGTADGLEACSEAQIGFTGFGELNKQYEPGVQTAQFTPAEASCPNGSKIAEVEIETPLLAHALKGFVYLAAQEANPFSSLFAMYIVARDPVSGTLIKLPGKVEPNPVTGQITTTFQNTPQLPFEELRLHFFGGERAPLATPSSCGAYTTSALFTPWSGEAAAQRSSTFDITSGPNGTPCESPLPFGPSLTAGTTSIQAGGFSKFTMTVSREDGQQDIQSLELHLPPGLSGLLTGVELCSEAQANAGTCGPTSLIGETTVSVGVGASPYSVTGGKVYITGPYEGAPFGISVVVPAKAGPFNLGTVVVRGTIRVDPVTSALTVTTNTPAQGDAIPHILDGIPLQIKHVNFTTTRSGFTFNPTNCDPMSVTGSVSSVQGASSNVSVPFQATNCATLAFKPGFAVSASGKTSRANGASLHVKLTYPKAAFGSQANVKSVKVDLPKQLPSRLTTLQKACPEQTFMANPASCPAASIVGHAKAITPLVPVALEGPAYFVSYGGAKFPELVVVLQGYGVTVDLHGETFINKAGITSSTFHTIPDVPVGTFELTLPQGKYSALAANGNLCTTKLTMPTAFTAQNGVEIHENTPVSATGCPKHARHKRKKTSGRKGRKR
ncbi:MAG TPA: hypothetical protein VK691_12045 [Solirubrobacteraceae bacterium]|jgi:hypothetical protein|nr:hypothetical protein [Solirubrobacteraceae bacterium]